MKNHLYLFFFLVCFLQLNAQINLIPKPFQLTTEQGEFVLQEQLLVALPANLSDTVHQIVTGFTNDLRTFGGKTVTLIDDQNGADLVFAYKAELDTEEYILSITSSVITITASRPAGYFYALQTLKQMLPPGISAKVLVASDASWSLPACTIADKPRFGWRGFMLDVGRHFFDVDQVKRIIDMMATYKMNRFHWHLTEDQGWRIEIKKYPKLTSVGSVRKYSQVWGNPEATTYYDYIPYGPYYYTQEDIKEVVAYAKEHFIEVVPEIDMPGHMQAAMAAYPEYSCTPNANHEVWTNYGISSDVLNVANPNAVQFVKDILDELIPLFPYEYIHIGGDECPTYAWERNAECQALLKSLGSANYRDLQTHFFKEIEQYLQTKDNPSDRRKVIAWNETLGGDLTGSNVTIMSWIDWYRESKKAADMKLDVIMTPQIPYYINRKQWPGPGEPFSQGHGSETLEAVYAFEPIPSDATASQRPYYKGVQANFWTEHVSKNEVLEYLMLPRLAAVAETGWTPQNRKNFNDFKSRIRKDTTLYQLRGWKYGNHYMVDKPAVLPQNSNDERFYWFRMITASTDVRAGKCVELLAEGSPLINASNSGSAVNRLWSNTQADEKDVNYGCQWWALVENPGAPGFYALVNKSIPGGSVNSTATASNNTGRWIYDTSKRHYDFILAEKYSENGSNRYYSIRSQKYPAMYMNLAAGGQQYAINLWGDPLDGNSGMFAFVPFMMSELELLKSTLQNAIACLDYPTYTNESDKVPGRFCASLLESVRDVLIPVDSVYRLSTLAQIATIQSKIDKSLNDFRESLAFPQTGVFYTLGSTKYEKHFLYHGSSTKLMHGADVYDDAGEWYFASIQPVVGEQAAIVQIRNRKSNYWIGTGMPIDLTSTPHTYTLSFNEPYLDWEIRGNSTPNQSRIFPIPLQSIVYPAAVTRDGVRATGTGWLIEPVKIPSSIDVQASNTPLVYSIDRRIVVENADVVEVFTALGIKINNHKNRTLNQGTYLVKADKFISKINIY